MGRRRRSARHRDAPAVPVPIDVDAAAALHARWRAALIDVLIENPVVSVRFLAQLLGVTPRRTEILIQQLVTVRILVPATGKYCRSQIYQADEVLALLAFGAEADARAGAPAGRAAVASWTQYRPLDYYHVQEAAVDLSGPINTVIPSAHGPILEVLARTDVPLTGRAVAALTEGRVSHARSRQVLLELVASGLVIAQEAPPARLYRLNRQHLAAEAVTALAGLRTTLLERMRELCGGWSAPARAVWLFGSLARGDSTASSDIDVLVVRPDEVEVDDPVWVEQLAEYADQVHAWTGNRCELLEYAESELATTLDARLTADIRDHGVVLSGARPATLLRAASRRQSRP